jgi:hypothetical protein
MELIFALVLATASASSQLAFTDTAGTCTFTQDGATTKSDCDFESKNILDEITILKDAVCREMGCGTCNSDLTMCTTCPTSPHSVNHAGRCAERASWLGQDP